MDLTTEQRALRDAVRGLLARHRPGSQDEERGYDASLWRRLCREIGVAGLAVPERYGGAGAGPVETHVVAEELGRGLTPSPLLGSAVLAAQALLASGDDAACRRLLPGIADGTSIAALAWTDATGHWDPAQAACRAASAGRAAADGIAGAADGTAGAQAADAADCCVLSGEAQYVLDGDTADVLIVAARGPAGIGLFDVHPAQEGVARSARVAMDGTRRVATVRLNAAWGRPIGPGQGGAVLARARDLACIALSAEQVGAAQRALDLTVEYTLTRAQFGRVIGGFQALQHRMADLHVLVESARSLSYAAAQAAAEGAPDIALRAAAAKVYCSEALTRVAGEMVQLHGAIGITWEHDAHRYLKRAHGAAQLFGRPAEHVARIAAALMDR
jgi:alkylation response protein AidB-like acyl-CoA dehydrogenase